MLRYIGRRLSMLIPVMIGVSLLVFAILYFTPGDPAALILGENASEVSKEAWRDGYGLNDPFWKQYLDYMKGIVTKWDFGNSYKTGQPITQTLMDRFPVTFLLAILASSLAMVVGMGFGILSANHKNSIIDTVISVLGIIGVSMPIFWLALLLIMYFAVELKMFPVSGWYGPKYWVLPSIALGLNHTASIMRITRSSMLDCMKQDYVRTARAKGQVEGVITRHHVLRNAMIPIITAVGAAFGIALGGAVILESIFSIPGLGRLMVDGINGRDYPQVRGSVMLLALSFSLVNLGVDVLYAFIDPRIKSQFSSSSKRKAKKTSEKAVS